MKIFWSFYRYNGLLGDYAINNHNISEQFMKKFLISHQLSRLDWPEFAKKSSLFEALFDDHEHRGTISTVGTDIAHHAEIALTHNLSSSQLSFSKSAIERNTAIGLNSSELVYLSDEDFKQIDEFYSSIFSPDLKPTLMRRVEVVKSLYYNGEYFQADNIDKVNCNIIRARWLKYEYPLQIDITERFARAGTIKRIMVCHHTISGVSGYMVLFQMDWFTMHSEPYSFGHHVQMYHKTVCEPGPYSFLPIQRVMSKCAMQTCKHDNITVNVVIPLSGHWAL